MKQYTYLFLTRDGTSTLPNKDNKDEDVENVQYLGELVTDVDSPSSALEMFLEENIFYNNYQITDFIIKRFNGEGRTYY